MAYTAYANYVIYFTDEGEYNFALSVNGGNPILQIAPAAAALMFGLTIPPPAGPLGAKGLYYLSPYTPGWNILHPGPSGVILDAAINQFTVPGQLSSFGELGQSMTLIWSATLTYMAVQPSIDPGDRAPVPVRRWYEGFECPENLVTQRLTRDASRTVEGMGWALRSPSNVNFTKRINFFNPALTTKKSWERFYVRIRKFGTMNIDIWKSGATPTNNAGIRIWITPAGDVEVYNVTVNPGTLVATALNVFTELDRWVRFDILIEYNPDAVGGNGGFRLFFNGVMEVLVTPVPANGGIGLNNQFHDETLIGTSLAGATDWELDIDDWHNAAIPELLGVETLNSYDWLLGTHGRLVKVNATTQVNWTGQPQTVNQVQNPALSGTTPSLTSSTSGAQIACLTDLSDEQDSVGTNLFPASVTIISYSSIASGAIPGRMGISLAGDPIQYFLNTLQETSTPQFNLSMYTPDGTVVVPPSMVPLIIVWEKGISAVLNTVKSLGAIVEQVGIFGQEDSPTMPLTQPYMSARHNASYPGIAAAFPGAVTDGPVSVVGGTYVGNGTTNTILLPLPAHFIYIRPVSSTNPGACWYGASLGGTRNDFGQALRPSNMLRADYDVLTGLASFTVIGVDVNVNQSAITYQYIAFCDPGMQYVLTGCFEHITAGTGEVNVLPDPFFTPVAAFVKPEGVNSTSTENGGFKGPAAIGATGNRLAGTALTDFLTFGTGFVISGTNAHLTGIQMTYALWRTGNNCASVMCQVFSYVGNGVSPRVIPCTPASGRWPLFVYVQPRNAVGFVKDPSDAAASSRNNVSGLSSATAITAVGNDTITVGSTLNTNLIEYQVFIIPGDVASMANGTYFPGNCLPDELEPIEPEPPIPGVHLLGNGGVAMNGQPPSTLLEDVSGIYTIVEGKRHDTLYDRQTGQPNVDVAIPRPFWKGGYIGG